MPESTSSKSERRGGSIEEKFESALISLRAYVSVIALTSILSACGLGIGANEIMVVCRYFYYRVFLKKKEALTQV
jgi:hypothetical protein